jgi:hypothetical protein
MNIAKAATLKDIRVAIAYLIGQDAQPQHFEKKIEIRISIWKSDHYY